MANSAIQGSTLIDFPAGMIMPFAGTTTPAGWLECDGSEVDINKYPTLAATLGVTWNTAKNPLTGVNHAAPAAGKFRVPDMRGSFLRGSSQGSNNAQGVSTALAEFQEQKTRKNGLNATAADSSISGTAAGQSQSTSNVSLASGSAANGGIAHTHSYSDINWQFGTFKGAGGIAGGSGVDRWEVGKTSGGASATNHTHPVSGTTNIGHTHDSSSVSGTSTAQAITVGDGDAETRPDAVGVRYLIKY